MSRNNHLKSAVRARMADTGESYTAALRAVQAQIVAQSQAAERTVLGSTCPDGGTCHHRCLQRCFRVATCEPLSGVFAGDRWPQEICDTHDPDSVRDRSGVVEVLDARRYAARVPAADIVTCGACRRSWDDAVPTSLTPAPSARCPFEYDHDSPDGWTLTDDGCRVELERLGDGRHGEYDPTDPDDEELLSFAVYGQVGPFWWPVDEGAQTTQVPASANVEVRRALLRHVAALVADQVADAGEREAAALSERREGLSDDGELYVPEARRALEPLADVTVADLPATGR